MVAEEGLSPVSATGRPAMQKWVPSIYFVIGQVGWFACVLGAARGFAWLGTLIALSLVTLHVLRVPRPREEIKLVATMVMIGAAWESALVHGGVLVYHTSPYSSVAPAWILAVWALFAAQFNTTYRWLKPHAWLAAVLGAIAGPLSFRAGAALGALHFNEPGTAVATLALGWAVLLPVLVLLSRRWDGVRPSTSAAAPT